MRVFAILICWLVLPGCLSTPGGGGCGGPWGAPICRCEDRDQTPGSHKTPKDHQPPRGGIVQIRITDEPASLLSLVDPDPIVLRIIDHNVMEALVRINASGDSVEPELAVKWSTDNLKGHYTFHLAPNARWHDGQPVTTKDVEFTLAHLTDPDSHAVLQDEFQDVSKVIIQDETTIEIQLDQPRPDFLHALAQMPILPAHVFGRTSLADHDAARSPIGSGPFRFVRWITGQSIEIERNPDWRGTPPYLDKIVYRILPDDRIALDLFRRGDLDIVADLAGSSKRPMEDAHRITYPLPLFEMWTYNTTLPIFARATTRRAIGMLIDREALRCSILHCRADLIEGPWRLGDDLTTDHVPLKYDPAKARKLLDDDGWRDSNGDGIRDRGGVDFSFSLLLPDTNRDLIRGATVVQEDLARVGIEMNVRTLSRGTFARRLKSRSFDAAVITVRTQSMFDAWSLFHSQAIEGGENFSGYADKPLDELLDRLHVETAPEERDKLKQLITQKLQTEAPGIFTFHPYASAIVRDSIGGNAIRNGWFVESDLWRTRLVSP
jgi:peptide/nickel transport system substrate-binding protein